MAFDEHFARFLARRRDRDAARFFADREREIDSFRAALDEARADPAGPAAFRVFQGAPGVGKSALLHRIEELRAGDALFVRLLLRDLADEDRLLARIEEVAGTPGSGIGFGSEPDGLTPRPVVLCLDEAQLVDGRERWMLVGLHSVGLGRPVVALFAGLSHTADRLAEFGGLSRLANNAVVDVRGMSLSECVESSRALLDALGAEGDRGGAAEFVARLSLGWPQHLKCAQSALCGELLRTDGNLDRVDFGRVARETDEARLAYYRGRLAGSVLGADSVFTAAVVAEARRREVVDAVELDAIGEAKLVDQRARFPLFADVAGTDFERLLVEKGVLSRAERGGFEVSIPSMVDWLDAQARAREAARGGFGRWSPKRRARRSLVARSPAGAVRHRLRL